MQELIVKTTLPSLASNFEIVKQQLVDGLKTYNVLITADTVKDGKAMAAEINKIKKAIKEKEKKALEDILGPANEFKDKIKELMDLADEVRDKITAQVSAYEEETKTEIQEKITSYLTEVMSESSLRYPFDIIVTNDLVKLGAITKTGNLTTATMNTIKGRITEQKNLQLEENAIILQEQKDKEDEIARIREEERIKAEANAQAHVTVEPPAQQVAPTYIEEHPQNFQEPVSEPYYDEPKQDFNPNTGEVYPTTPPHVEKGGHQGMVKITAEFEVDISSIPNITNEQLTNAIQNRLKAADVNNSTIVAIYRYYR